MYHFRYKILGMITKLRKFVPQKVINYSKHLPAAILANYRFGFPGKKLKVIGVTGTDGKTTTVNMIYQILKAAEKKVSMISTINAPGFHVTSPDPFTVQKFTKQALESGDEYLILEVTSHGLDQYRFWGIKFEVGVITNVTHEHLDYHKTFEKYLHTKFKLLKNVRFAVINSNLKTNVPRSWDKCLYRKLVTFGFGKGDFNQRDIKLKLHVPGDYNVENALAAYAVASVLGIEKIIAKKALENFEGIAGRMEEVKNNRGIEVFVDFAHTPNALDQALKTLREQTKGRLISLIGAEGQRDIEKRPLLGEVAARLSDLVVITAVDPRGQLEKINQQIIEGAKKEGAKEGKNLFVISDRKEAIDFAINKLAKKGDVVGIFGKGHEKSINYTGIEEPWSDVEVVRGVLKNGRPY